MDKIFLRENKSEVFRKNAGLFKGMLDEGFLDFGQWEGQPPKSTMLWLNRCSAPDMAGAFSWIMFSDLDQYMVMLNECAPSLHVEHSGLAHCV